ncbi:diguanylate cyclase [bacterium]|nr:diguanylate cyclase [bacterium]
MNPNPMRRTSQPPEKLNLLIVDSEAPRLFPRDSELREIFNLFVATTTDGASVIIQQNEIHIALCEDELPEDSGSEFLAHLKTEHPGIIRILSAEKSSATTMMEAINKANIFKFIVKPWDFRMRTILEEAKQYYIARYKNQYNDNLTNLRSTTAIYDILHSELTRSFRHKLTFSAILLEITSPDSHNDLHSFLVDRFLLKKIADILLNELRESDCAGRLKDNKFLVLLTEADAAGSQVFLGRFLERVASFDQNTNRGLLPFKIITGIETLTGAKLVTENDLIATLYHKLHGKDRQGRVFSAAEIEQGHAEKGS